MWKLLVPVVLLGSGLPTVFSGPSHSPPGATRHDVADAQYLKLGDAQQFAPVALLRAHGDVHASAILVSPYWLLTAGHSADGIAPGDLTVEIAGSSHRVVEIVMHPEFRPRSIGNGTDLALIRLADPVLDVRAAVRYRGYSERSQVATAVGFGVAGTGTAAVTSPAPSGTKRAGTNVIDAIGGMIDGRRVPANLLVADFDRPGDPSHNRLGSPLPLALEYMPLGGDSGGGLFIQQNGLWMLAGVFSGYTFSVGKALEIGMYGSLMYWTRLSLYNDWVDRVTSTPTLTSFDFLLTDTESAQR